MTKKITKMKRAERDFVNAMSSGIEDLYAYTMTGDDVDEFGRKVERLAARIVGPLRVRFTPNSAATVKGGDAEVLLSYARWVILDGLKKYVMHVAGREF